MKIIIVVALLTGYCWGTNAVYIAQNSAGGNTGLSCANAKADSYFNTAGNWSATPTGIQIGPDTTVHLCGTFTGALNASQEITTQGNGSSGHPVIIVFEVGAVFTSPAWGSGAAISIPNNFITLNGVCTATSAGLCTATQGTVENTLVGTAGGACLGGPCSNQQYATKGVDVSGSNDIVENLTVTHIWTHTFASTDALTEDGSTAIGLNGANNLALDNIIDNVYSGIGMGANSSGSELSFNTISFCNHCITIGINSGTVTGLKVHDNSITNAYVWDEENNRYHHNGIFAFADPAGSITGDYYNNFIGGIFTKDTTYGASHTTGYIFLEFDMHSSRAYNNFIAPSAGDLYGTANGMITAGGAVGEQFFYNNTLISTGGACFSGGNTGIDFRNNILINCGFALNLLGSSSTPTVIDHNSYYNIGLGGFGQGWVYNGSGQVTFQGWQSACSCDASSTNGVGNLSLTVNSSTKKIVRNIAGGNGSPNWTVGGVGVSSVVRLAGFTGPRVADNADWTVTAVSTTTNTNDTITVSDPGNALVSGTDTAVTLWNPLVNSSTGLLQSGSYAIGFGQNLTSLGIVPLDSDKAGVLRPTSAPWDDGAFQFGPSAGFSVSPNPQAFGNVNVGSSGGPTTITITNTGTASLVIGTLSSNNAKFVISSDLCSGQTVAASSTCTFALTFSPTTAGSQAANITVPDNAGNPDSASATGTGVAVVTGNDQMKGATLSGGVLQ